MCVREREIEHERVRYFAGSAGCVCCVARAEYRQIDREREHLATGVY